MVSIMRDPDSRSSSSRRLTSIVLLLKAALRTLLLALNSLAVALSLIVKSMPRSETIILSISIASLSMTKSGTSTSILAQC